MINHIFSPAHYIRSGHTESGFSLVELLVAIVIVGILTSIALPSYQKVVAQARRTDGMSELTRVMNQQEKYFLGTMRYATDLSKLGFRASATGVISEEGYYRITAAACPGSRITQCVLLSATPQDAQEGDGTLTLSSRGERTWAGDTGWP